MYTVDVVAVDFNIVKTARLKTALIYVLLFILLGTGVRGLWFLMFNFIYLQFE